jgi:Arc-like DNA binding domain
MTLRLELCWSKFISHPPSATGKFLQAGRSFRFAGGVRRGCRRRRNSIYKPVWLRYGSRMASITLKDIPVDLHAQLKQEADANYRSLNQELLARIQRSFDQDEQFTTNRVNRLIQEAMDSGPEEPLSLAKFDSARNKARAKFQAKRKAA